jgi:hypothetical protein
LFRNGKKTLIISKSGTNIKDYLEAARLQRPEPGIYTIDEGQISGLKQQNEERGKKFSKSILKNVSLQ